MTSDRHSQQVAQEVSGQGNQVAGRDFYNQVQDYSPPADSPYLRPCKACGWHGVALNAPQCGKCGYDYAQERATAANRYRRQYERFVMGSIIATGAVVMAAAATSNRTSLDFLDALALCVGVAVATWGVWTWFRAWSSVRWKALKRRWKNGAS